MGELDLEREYGAEQSRIELTFFSGTPPRHDRWPETAGAIEE
jgi:hypothetical protein